MRRTKHFLATICAVLLMASLVSGCHTVNGMGKDVQAGGQAVSNAATYPYN